MEIKETIENNKKTIILEEDLHRTITFKIDSVTNQLLEHLSLRLNVTKTKLVITMIRTFIEESEENRNQILNHKYSENSHVVVGIRVPESLLSIFMEKIPKDYPYTVALRNLVRFYVTSTFDPSAPKT